METQEIINKTERPNSYEFGKAGDRFKVYFNTPEDLKKLLDDLTALGLTCKEVIE